MPAEPAFPALERLTEDVATAMHQAEVADRRRTRWPGWKGPAAIVLVALAGGVPTALAVRSAVRSDTRVSVPDSRIVAGKPEGGTASAFVIARGYDERRYWTVVARRCKTREMVTLAPGATIGRRPAGPEENGGGFSQCPQPGARARRQPLLLPMWQWTPNLSVLYGIVPARVASVVLRVRERRCCTNQTFGPKFDLRTVTRPFAAAAIEQGDLPRGYKLFVITRRGDVVATRATARDARGQIIRSCSIRQCEAQARRSE